MSLDVSRNFGFIRSYTLIFEYPYFTELASLATYISQSHLSLDVSLSFQCFIRLWMLFWLMNLTSQSSFLNAILIYETPYFTELASLAKYFSITLVVGCFSYFRMLYSSLVTILVFEYWEFTSLHGARFARKILFNHTCRRVLL